MSLTKTIRKIARKMHAEHLLVDVYFRFKVFEFLNVFLFNNKPRLATIAFTNKCNSRCVFCEVHEQLCNKKEIPKERMLSLIDEMKKTGVKKLHLVGGEVFVRKDAFELLEYIKSKGIAIYITTNGLLMPFFDKKKLDIIKNTVSSMVFSLDSTDEQQYDWIRGIPGAYKKVTAAIKKVAEMNGPSVMITAVVMRPTLKEIPKLIKLGHELGVDFVSFQTVSPITVFEDTKTKKGKTNFLLKTKKDLDLLDRCIDEGIDVGKELGVANSLRYFKLIARPYFESFIEHYKEPYLKRTEKNLKCVSALRGPYIDYDGSFKPCIVLGPMGNIYTESFGSLWDKEKKFRKALMKGKLPKQCGYCFCNPGESVRFSRFYNKLTGKF